MEESGGVCVEILKSPLDDREYLGLVLSNMMKVIIISDPTSDVAAAALTIATGSMNDPPELPGLAHICEHMLFLGTAKYPEENDWRKFIAENGGSQNASTGLDKTTYDFEVAPDALKPALERFVQFFISPLFSASALEREINVVHSEHEQNIGNQYHQSAMVEKVTIASQHPYSHFPTGNRTTLWTIPNERGEDVRESLKKFYECQYSSNLMTLAVLGVEKLDILQRMVVSIFEGVQDKRVSLSSWSPPYILEDLETVIEVSTAKEMRFISLIFPIPDISGHYKTFTDEYVSNLIGHEGVGSLFSFLRKQGWVTSLLTGVYEVYRVFSKFQVDMELTQSGFNKLPEVIESFFQLVNMLQSKGPQRFWWEELVNIRRIDFKFKSQKLARSLVTRLSKAMQKYPLRDTLSAEYLFTEYNPTLIKGLMGHITPRNMRVLLQSKEGSSAFNLVEQYYGTKYAYRKIPLDLIERWETCGVNCNFTFPKRNVYIPAVLELIPRELDDHDQEPKMLKETCFYSLWFLKDLEFQLPQTFVYCDIISPTAMKDPLHNCLRRLMTASIEDALVEELYPAEMVGITYEIEETPYGMKIEVSGYSDKVPIVLGQIFQQITNLDIDYETFKLLRQTELDTVKNWETKQPRILGLSLLKFMMEEKAWSIEQRLNALRDVTLTRLQSYCRDFINQIHIKVFAYGNLTEKNALEIMAHNLQLNNNSNNNHNGIKKQGSQTGRESGQVQLLRQAKIPSGTDIIHIRPSPHTTSCVIAYFQLGVAQTPSKVVAALITEIGAEPCFHQLRTVENLGYSVSLKHYLLHGCHGIYICLQTDKDPAFVASRIENFLQTLHETLKNLAPLKFQKHRNSLRSKLEERPQTMREKGGEAWTEILNEERNFFRREKEITALKSLKIRGVLEFYENHFLHGSHRRNSVWITLASPAYYQKLTAANTGVNGVARKNMTMKVADISLWKKSALYYERLLQEK